MGEGIAKANGIDIWYETFGSKERPAVLLIMGTGGQGIFWDEEFCDRLARAGRFVIRFDNRDVGLSTWFDDRPPRSAKDFPPEAVATFEKHALSPDLMPAYFLDDMARDGVGLLDALGVERAHVVGMSSGGFIAQTIAIKNPDRVSSLTSVGSSPYGPLDPEAEPPDRAQELNLFELPTATREDRIAFWMKALSFRASPLSAAEERVMRRLVETAVDRAWHLEGMLRIVAAIMFSPSRVNGLRTLRVPTLIVHGAEDRAVPVWQGIATANLVPNAELLVVDGMGHDLPLQATWSTAFEALIRHTGQHDSGTR